MRRFKDPRQRLEISHAVQEECQKKKKKTLVQSSEKSTKIKGKKTEQSINEWAFVLRILT